MRQETFNGIRRIRHATVDELETKTLSPSQKPAEDVIKKYFNERLADLDLLLTTEPGSEESQKIITRLMYNKERKMRMKECMDIQSEVEGVESEMKTVFFKQNDGFEQSMYYRTSTNHKGERQFRFVCDDVLRPLPEGVHDANTLFEELTKIRKATWPNSPGYWPKQVWLQH